MCAEMQVGDDDCFELSAEAQAALAEFYAGRISENIQKIEEDWEVCIFLYKLIGNCIIM